MDDKQKRIVIVTVFSIVVIGFILANFPNGNFSTVETTFGTVSYDSVNSGLTLYDNLEQTDITGGYTEYSITTGSPIKTINTKIMDISKAPAGTSFAYSLAWIYDPQSSTDEIIFIDLLMSAKDLQWQSAKIYLSAIAVHKEIVIVPTDNNGHFFIFLTEPSLSSYSSFFIQIKAHSYALNDFVFLTGYFEYTFSYATLDQTVDLQTKEYQPVDYNRSTPFLFTLTPFMFIYFYHYYKVDQKKDKI